jgi:HSP20 family protein
MLSRLGEWEGQFATQMMSPTLDVTEADGYVDVTMDIPGMKAENIDIQVHGNRLTISGERKEEKEEKGNGKSYHRIERHMGQFSRTVTLPCAVDQGKVEATYQNGVLKLHMPKTEEEKSHKIKVTEKK